MTQYLNYAVVICGALSAVFWFWSAAIKTPLPMAYLSGPPSDVVRRINAQSRYNRIAAVLAGLAVLAQAASSGLALATAPRP